MLEADEILAGEKQGRRALVLSQVLAGTLSTREAAELLGLSVRQVRRLKAEFRRQGRAALVHGNRGRRSVRRLSDERRARLVELATTRYLGCPHDRLRGVLAEREQIVVSRSTLRRVLLAAGVRSPGRRGNRPLAVGMMPVAFDWVQGRVELLDMRGAEFREPSFQGTVERWRRSRPTAVSVELDLAAFVAAARVDPGRLPDGFIFGIGRVGPALVADLLSVSPEHRVIKESPVVNALLTRLLNAPDEPSRQEREMLLELALPFMLRLAPGTARRLLFKLTSWNIRLADTLLRFFSSTPAAFVYEPPGVAVAAMLHAPPGWRHLFHRDRAIQARYFPTLAQVPAQTPLSVTTFYAHVWRSAAEAALALPSKRLFVLEHEQLLVSPESTLARLQDRLGLSASPDLLESMRLTVRRAAEQTAGRVQVDPSRESEVLAVVGDLPSRLAAHARGEVDG